MIDFSSAAPNQDTERNGVWRTWSNGTHTVEFLLARAGGSNLAFRTRAEELTRVYRRSGVDLAQLPTPKQDEINRELYADTVVRGWKSSAFGGLNRENFTKENLVHMFTVVPDTLAFAIGEATSAQNYLNETLSGEAGNSLPS